MKKLKVISFAFLLIVASVLMTACGGGETITLGTYNETSQTFTATTSNSLFSLQVNGYNLNLKGTIPYSNETLGISAGNIVAIKFVRPSGVDEADAGTTIKTTNRQETSGWNAYTQNALESDGSLIWVTRVSKDNSVQIKIKWNTDTEEVTYTLSVDTSATMATSV